MKLFECFFRDPDKPWEYYERYYDGKDSKVKKIDKKQFTFIEDKNGDFEYFLDNSIKLRKVQDSKDITSKKYGTTNPGYANIRDEYWDFDKSRYNKNARIGYLDIETTAKAPINVEECNEQIVLIQIFDKLTNTNIILGLEDFNPEHINEKYSFNNETFDFKVKYLKCKNEVHLLESFFKILKTLKFLIVYAHNGNNFDFHYLYKRPLKLGITPDFSPFGFKSELKQDHNGYSLNVPGCIFLDFMDLYKKFVLKPRESYSLDFLAKTDLKYGKVNHDCFKTFEGFRTGEGYIIPETEPTNEFEKQLFYNQNTPKFKEIVKDWFIHYGIIDTYLLFKIDDKFKLTDTLIMIASMMGVNPEDSLGTTKQWSQCLANFVYKDKKILPDIENSDIKVSVKGGFVRDPRLSKIDWGFSLDVNSMYPLLGMYSFNMSPETFIPYNKLPKELQEFKDTYLYDEDEERLLKLYYEKPEILKNFSEICKKYNIAYSINGAFFSKDEKGIIPEIILKIYTDRKKAKKEMLTLEAEAEKLKEQYRKNNDEKLKSIIDEKERRAIYYNVLQISLKTSMNSLYGGLSNKYFLLFNQEIARAITGNGRFFIQLVAKRVNDYLQTIKENKSDYCIYGDTDSCYFALDHIGEELTKGKTLKESKEIIDNFINEKIQPKVEESILELADIFNAVQDQKIGMKREVIFKGAVWLSKKKYFMRELDNEGVEFLDENNPEIKKQGIEIVKSSTPPFARKFLEEATLIILEKDQKHLQDWLNNVKEQYLNYPLMEIARTSGVNSLNYDLEKPQYKDGRKVAIPINSRSVLVSNKYIKENNLELTFNPMTVNEKVKMLYLKEPNPLNSDSFAFNNEKFAQMFKDYVDFDKNWDLMFLKSLELMINNLGWNVRNNKSDLDW